MQGGIFLMIEICRWNELFENNRSREIRHPMFCLIPNRHDGESYGRLMMLKDAPEIFSAWILMVQVASRSQVRGTLLRDDRTPHDAESLSIKTRGRKEWFEKAIPVLEKLRWIAIKSGIPQEGAVEVRQRCDVMAAEGKGREGDILGEKDFDLIWKEYPCKDGRKEAFRHFLASVKTPADLVLIGKAIVNYRTSRRVQDGFIKNGSTWFNNWRDWIEPPIDSTPKKKAFAP
mgnify:CR=1 FL=1